MAEHNRQLTSPDTIDSLERRQEALLLRRSGLSYERIAEQMSCSAQNAHKLVKACLAVARERLAEDAELLLTLEAERLDVLQLAVWGKAVKGDVAAVAAVLKIMERRARLFGLEKTTEALEGDRLVDELLAKVVVIGGSKQEYIDSLRRVHQLGQAARALPQAG